MYNFRSNVCKVINNMKLERLLSTKSPKNEISPIFTNRNPRNLEKLRIGYKPDGYHVEAPGKRYWHKLKLESSSKYVTASVYHFENEEVIQASTSEWALKKQLYKTADSAAYINLGRVLAQRCIESGLTELSCFIEPPTPDGKVALFLKALEEGGICLKEPPQYKPSRPWDLERPEKPWEVIE
ncbi:mitochondrial ribosomal protein L18 [Leptinotarsa decemlineata]|uniref:mitochondrial ribosomal protein L18 n=1 Tax=Leptinotarsa decemlineata TaxID=7539 RepID=UPI003D30B621